MALHAESFEDATALVTGAGGLIGGLVAEALSERGVKVVAADLSERHPRVGSATKACDWIGLDVTKEHEWVAAAERIAQQYGRLDILVNSAGIVAVGSIENLRLEDWRRCQQINVEGTFLGIKSCLPLLRKAGEKRPGGASVVNLSATSGNVGVPFNAAYCASKAAVNNLTRAAAMEFCALKYPVRVNAVLPGAVESDMMGSVLQRYVDLGLLPDAETGRTAALAMHPIGRFARPEEIVTGILFLCSSASSYMQGAELVIDGGFSSQ